jgi:hypothetical protein
VVSERDATTESVSPVRDRERRNLKAIAGTAVVVLVVLGFASYKLAGRAGHSGKPAAGHPAVAAVRTNPPSPRLSSSPLLSSPSDSPSASASASASPSAAAPQVLKPASAAAFGPDGAADGDGAEQAGDVIDGGTAPGWRSDWYSTPQFGGLQTGTGLLVDMGKPVTVDSVQVVLASAPGADFEIKAGNTPDPADLATVATSSGPGGTVNLNLAKPVQARYVLVWFTALPPDNAGTYQAQVSEISVSGQP